MKIICILLLLIPILSTAQNEPTNQSDTTRVDTLSWIPEMEITAKRLLVKRNIDGLQFTVEGSPLQHLNAWEILGRTPHVQTLNEQLTVKGNSSVIVLLNGKRTYLSATELKNLLESKSGNDIYAIEVITNPPAKYDAQGGAVLNIKMKTSRLLGYKGNFLVRYDQATYARGRIGTAHTYTGEKFQLTGNYHFVNGSTVRFNEDQLVFASNNTVWNSIMTRKSVNKQQHLMHLSSSFKLDSLSELRVGMDVQLNPKVSGNYYIPTYINQLSSGVMESFYLTGNQRDLKQNTVNSFLTFDRTWKTHAIQWSSNYGFLAFDESQDVKTHSQFAGQPITNQRFINSSNQVIHVLTNQLDYQWGKDAWKLESGVKHSAVDNASQLLFSDEWNGVMQVDPTRSTNFKYNEQIGAAYFSASVELDKWSFKGGIRGEYTFIRTRSNQPLVDVKTNRFNAFPSLSIVHAIKEDQQLGLSYSKRIDRPIYSFLNPAKSYFNKYSYFQGDPYLKAALMDNVTLFYTVKDWNFEISYEYTKFPSMEISFQHQATYETIYQYTNIKNSNALNASIYKDFNVLKCWKITTYAMGQLKDNRFFGIDGELYRKSNFFYYASINSQWTMDKAKSFYLSLGFRYNSNSIQGPFEISASKNLFFQLTKKWMDGKLETSLLINDVFRTDKVTISAKYADQHQRFTDYRDLQSIQLNLKWNFGNQKVRDAKKHEKTDEQNRM